MIIRLEYLCMLLIYEFQIIVDFVIFGVVFVELGDSVNVGEDLCVGLGSFQGLGGEGLYQLGVQYRFQAVFEGFQVLIFVCIVRCVN